MDTVSQCFLILVALLSMCSSLPSPSLSSTSLNKTSANKTSLQTDNAAILPENAYPVANPDMSHFEEIQEENIPQDAVVLLVEEQLQEHPDGEIMDTANNIVFRPLFRYREKQTQRIANRRTRRRYYVPRRSYRDNYYPSYYRPYRSISRRTYRPNRLRYQNYPVLA